MGQFFSTYRRSIIGAALWLVLFAFYSPTAWQQLPWPVFSSPDETANFAFAQQVWTTGQAVIPSDFPGAPRSVVNTGNALTPGSFIFFPAFIGVVGKVLGTFGMLCLGPALAALAVLAWWSLLARHIGRRGAWVGAALFATYPAFWFYASRGLWQNGVFVSLLVLTLWCVSWAWRQQWWVFSVGAGLLGGMALAIRPSEISWVGPGVMIVGLALGRRVPWKRVALAAAGFAVPLLVLFALQFHTYGNVSAVSYRPEGAFSSAPVVEQLSSIQKVKNVFFPFGTKLDIAWERFTAYGLTPLWYLVVPGVLGCGWYLVAYGRRRVTWAIAAGIGVSAFLLILLYGNYRFIEYPAVKDVTLDHSYLRYWLPFALLMSFGGAFLGDRLVRHGAWSKKFAYTLVGVYAAVSIMLAGFDRTIGLYWTGPRIADWQKQSKWMVGNTPAGSLIIAGSSDKVVFPRRWAIGYNGLIQPGTADLGDLPGRTAVYALVSTVLQRNLVVQRYPNYTVGDPLVGPDGFVLVPLTLR